MDRDTRARVRARPLPHSPDSYPDHKHGTLDFVGGGSDKLGGDSVHGVVQHPQRRNQLKAAQRTFRIAAQAAQAAHGLRQVTEAKLAAPPHSHHCNMLRQAGWL